MSKINVYTDGACKGNPGKGGWGWCEYSGKKYNGKEIIFIDSGGVEYTTNNKMELTAIIEHLKYAPKGRYYIIHSDSKYSLQGIVKGGEGTLKIPGVYTGWLKGWIKTNFVGQKNVELWKELESLINTHLKNGSILEFKYVKAHVGIEGNELADSLANIGVPKR